MPGHGPLVQRVAATLVLGVVCAVVPGAARGAGCPCGTVADEFHAADAGLVREWILQVPFDSSAARLERVVVGDGLVVAQSGDGGLHAIRTAPSGGTSARAGTLAWSQPIGMAAGHAWPATIGTRLVVVASETAVHAIDRETGALEWERPTDTITAAAAVQSGPWVYAPLASNRVLRLPANPLGQPVPVELPPEQPAAGRRGQKPEPPPPPESLDPVSIEAGGTLGTAPEPLSTGVVWSTSAGLVALERTRAGWLRHQFPAEMPPSWIRREPLALAGQPVVRGGSVFVATTGGGLARIDLNAPGRPGLRTVWQSVLPDRASSGPLVAGDAVVVALGPAGLVASAAADGRELWRTDLAGTPVAVAGGRIWVLDPVGRLTALDPATGSRRQSFCPGCFTLPVVNTLTERLVLASPGGVVVSLAAPAASARPLTAGDRPPAAPAPADPGATPR